MKNRLAILCLVISVLAIAYAAWLHVEFNRRLEESAYQALRTRERELIQEYWPRFGKMWKNMGLTLEDYPENPESIEELIQPFLDILEMVE